MYLIKILFSLAILFSYHSIKQWLVMVTCEMRLQNETSPLSNEEVCHAFSPKNIYVWGQRKGKGSFFFHPGNLVRVT